MRLFGKGRGVKGLADLGSVARVAVRELSLGNHNSGHKMNYMVSEV